MDERVMQFRVGVMFLATLIITGILLVMFGKLPSLIGRNYPVQVRFDYAAGVTKDTPVRKSGILIGRVERRPTDRPRLEGPGDADDPGRQDDLPERGLLRHAGPVGRHGDRRSFPTRRSRRVGEPIAAATILEGKISDDPTGLKTGLGRADRHRREHRQGA